MLCKDLAAAFSRPMVLTLLSQGDSYGYAIIKRVAELSKKRITGRTACYTLCCTS